jgi:hypothetical protein
MSDVKQFPTVESLKISTTYDALLNSIIHTLYGTVSFIINGNDLNLSELFSLSQVQVHQLVNDLPLELNRLGCNYLLVYVDEETFDLMVSYNY